MNKENLLGLIKTNQGFARDFLGLQGVIPTGQVCDWVSKLEDTMIKDRTINDLLKANKSLAKRVKELEPKKPIIPQFVADYIEKYNVDEYGLTSIGDWLDIDLRDEMDKKVDAWLYDCSYCVEEIIEREVLLINAIQHGYEIEKEKLYRVELPSGHVMYNSGAKEKPSYSYIPKGLAKESPDSTFTEKEIKAIDERYWMFKKEVTQ